jgi:hypothetical protein
MRTTGLQFWVAALLAVLATQSVAFAQTTDAFITRIPGANITSSVNFSLSTAVGAPGVTVQLPLSLTSTGTALPAGFQIDLSFDTTKMTFSSVTAGTPLTGAGKTISSVILPNGNVRLTVTGGGQTIANGVVATASFTVLAGLTTGSSAIATLNCSSTGATGTALATGCAAGGITAFTCDIGDQGTVDAVDVQLLLNEVLGLVAGTHDLNHDGVVNILDAQKEIQVVLGQACVW